MLSQINTSTAAMAQDLILVHNFHLEARGKNVIIFEADMNSPVPAVRSW